MTHHSNWCQMASRISSRRDDGRIDIALPCSCVSRTHVREGVKYCYELNSIPKYLRKSKTALEATRYNSQQFQFGSLTLRSIFKNATQAGETSVACSNGMRRRSVTHRHEILVLIFINLARTPSLFHLCRPPRRVQLVKCFRDHNFKIRISTQENGSRNCWRTLS